MKITCTEDKTLTGGISQNLRLLVGNFELTSLSRARALISSHINTLLDSVNLRNTKNQTGYIGIDYRLENRMSEYTQRQRLSPSVIQVKGTLHYGSCSFGLDYGIPCGT